jgi:hypothetical protein
LNETMALDDLTPAQRALADYMSELSEEAYYAGWMNGLEFALWEAMLSGHSDYGPVTLTLSETPREKLRQLAEACGGWIIFDDATEETFLPATDWTAHYGAWQRLRASTKTVAQPSP